MGVTETKLAIEQYLDCGLCLVPVTPYGKNPIIKNWSKSRLNTMDKLEPYLKDNINIGTLTGKVTGLIVIDIDLPKEGNRVSGFDSLTKIEKELGVKLPPTVIMQTQRGGIHYWFKYPEGYDYIKGKVGVLPNFDIRADGNQVLLPPSVGDNGKYIWIKDPIDNDISELPYEWIQWIASNCDAIESNNKSKTDSPNNVIQLKKQFILPDIIEDGTRNDTLYKYTCSLLSKGNNKEEAFKKVQTANTEKCATPLHEMELVTCFNSAFKTYSESKIEKINESTDLLVKSLDDIPQWLMMGDKGFTIDEVRFAQDFIKNYNLKFINYVFYNENNEMTDGEITKIISDMISPYIKKSVASKTNALIEMLRHQAYVLAPEIKHDLIGFKNGTYKVTESGLQQIKSRFNLNRLNHEYLPDTPCPMWHTYLSQLFHEKDIPILQEYLGYMLIPSTLAQRALFIMGKGGEGKSIISGIMNKILHRNAVNARFHAIQTNRFLIASMENKLAFIDDDMNLEAIKDTSIFKTLVTAQTPLEVERKGRDFFTIIPYAKFLCLSNGNIESQYDQSDAFYRRLLLIHTIPKDENRKDDVLLLHKLEKELSGIIAWCVKGLERLIANGYRFSDSTRITEAVNQLREERNNIIQFLKDESFVSYAYDSMTLHDVTNLTGTDDKYAMTSKEIYQSYCEWCDLNALRPKSQRIMLNHVKMSTEELNIRESNKISRNGKFLRGFIGIHVKYTYNNTFNIAVPTLD